MKNFFRLALKNVLRNTRRSLLTGFIIALGIIFVFTIRGFINGLQQEITNNITKGLVGEIQITRKGYLEALPARSMDFLFSFTPAIRSEILSVPNVSGIAPRLQFTGMINHQRSQTTTPFLAVAIDPVEELLVCPRLKDMIREDDESIFLDPHKEHSAKLSDNITDDIELAVTDDIDFSKPVASSSRKNLDIEESEYHQVLVGPYMQEGFFSEINGEKSIAQIGDEMVLITMSPEGSQKSLPVNLTGVMESTNPTADKTIIYMVLESARSLLSSPEKVTQLVVSLNDASDRFDTVKELNRILDPHGLTARPWDEVQKFFVNIMDLQNAFFGIIMVIILLFVVVAIIITTLMTVSERIREIGTLMAIGYRRKHIMRLFLLESTLISTTATFTGMIVGFLVLFIMNQVGMNFIIPGTATPVVIHPFPTAGFSVITVIVGFIAGIAGAIYPAYNASRQTPLEAMAHI